METAAPLGMRLPRMVMTPPAVGNEPGSTEVTPKFNDGGIGATVGGGVAGAGEGAGAGAGAGAPGDGAGAGDGPGVGAGAGCGPGEGRGPGAGDGDGAGVPGVPGNGEAGKGE